MFSSFHQWLKDSGAYLWSAWGPAAALLLFAAVWETGHQIYGSFILPSPIEAATALIKMFQAGTALPAALTTASRAMTGFVLAVLVGSALGMLAGLSKTAARALRPLITVLLGMPPIAWLVLALMWFGLGGGTAVFTTVISALPITFANAMMGVLTIEQQHKDMARSFKVPFSMALTDIYLPHILSYLFPAWITALGVAWKTTVMGELLSTDDGIGGAMALTRINMDTAGTMGLLLCVLAMLIAVEYLFLEPLRRRMEPWRQMAGQDNQKRLGGF
jgi:NitT/TauT family transport system permease protein